MGVPVDALLVNGRRGSCTGRLPWTLKGELSQKMASSARDQVEREGGLKSCGGGLCFSGMFGFSNLA